MSHFKERKEKICLNCNAELQGRFCHKCGQENIEPKESFLHLLSHLVSHEFHFDSKFFSTAKHLLLTPGFLTKEYMAGRRVSYLDPIRMYIFLSAFFFLVVFSLNKGETNLVNATYKNSGAKKQALAVIKGVKEEIKDSLSDTDDSLSSSVKETLKQRELLLDKYENYLLKDSTNADSILHLLVGKSTPAVTFFGSKGYKSLEEYDSTQKVLPAKKRDNFLVRTINRKGFEQMHRFNDNPKEFMEHIKEEMIHSFSEIFFLSLPFFALILQMLYLRNRNNFYYVNHFVYTLHLYSGTFFIALITFLVDRLKVGLGWHWINYIIGLLAIYGVYFSYKSMRTFYGQSRGKTLVKFMLVSFSSIVMFAFLFLIFLIISAYRA